MCQWPRDLYNFQFQQKTYAIANDGYCYVLTSRFNRSTISGLLLFRVPQNQVGVPGAYQPWGYANGSWNWGNYPTSITTPRQWGEICFRAMGGQYAFTWFQESPAEIRAQGFPFPTSNLYTTTEQVIITNGTGSSSAVLAPYGGFIFPGSSFSNFNIAVGQWPDNSNTNYHVMQYRCSLV